jgi:prepilin-type N-terminal cleavage/methylation domain-containing protein/prepilin-type processing-associated H-X9-DG protein
MRSTNRRGFTLIELLVVIAIIAILAAILFPVFARAREKARQTSCLSNEKQISLSWLMYADDYDETVVDSQPLFYASPPPLGIMNQWEGAILPYVKNLQLFTCPSHKDWAPYPQTYGSTTALPAGVVDQTGYGYNGSFWAVGDAESAFDGPYASSQRLDGVGLSQMPVPADTLLIGDSANGNTTTMQGRGELGDRKGSGVTLGASDPWDQGKDYYPEYRHNGGFNLAFADGHAKFRQGGRLPRGIWTIEDD